MAALHKLEDSYGARTRERDDALANIDRLLETNKRHVTERDEARSEVRRLQSIIDEQDTEHDDVSDDLRRVRAEYDALREKYEALNADHRDFILARRRANDLESEGNRLRTENANLKDSAHALTTERDRLAARVREHEETLAVLSNVNAELFKTQQELREARDENERVHNHRESLEKKLLKLREHVQELQAETVEQENRYNHLALVVVDLLKERGVE
jgi:chromosome segregation ATPase